MRKIRSVMVIVLGLLLVLAFTACDKKDESSVQEGSSSEKVEAYQGETAEVTLDDALIVKYPAAFKVDEVWSGDYNVCLEKEGEKWEVTVGVYKYDDSYPDFEAIVSDNKASFGNGVKTASLAGKEGITYKAPSAIQYLAPLNEKKYIVFACKSQPNEEGEDFATAFNTAEVQYILNNIQIK